MCSPLSRTYSLMSLVHSFSLTASLLHNSPLTQRHDGCMQGFCLGRKELQIHIIISASDRESCSQPHLGEGQETGVSVLCQKRNILLKLIHFVMEQSNISQNDSGQRYLMVALLPEPLTQSAVPGCPVPVPCRGNQPVYLYGNSCRGIHKELTDILARFSTLTYSTHTH